MTGKPEVIDGYVPPYAPAGTRPSVRVRCGEWWLRYSRGPRTGAFWDAYGDDFQTVDLATSELAKAPPVPDGKPYREFSINLGGVAG